MSFPLAQLVWRSPGLLPVAAAVGVALVLAVIWLYPPQLRGLGGLGRWGLPALRSAAMLALAVSLMKPAAVRLATARERGEVVILFDRSRSASVVDNTRTPQQLVALADALGNLPAGVRRATAEGLGADVQRLRSVASDVQGAQDDLDYARVSGRDIDAREARLRETAARFTAAASAVAARAAAIPQDAELRKRLADLVRLPSPQAPEPWRTEVRQRIDQAEAALLHFEDLSDGQLYASNPEVRRACDEVARLPRFALAQEALLRPGSGLLSRLGADTPVSAFGFARDITPLPIGAAGRPVPALAAAPDGRQTDLTAAIPAAVAGRTVRAVVVFSDGRQVGGDSTNVSGLTPSGVPVFTVATAPASAPRDLSFERINSPASAFAGETVVVRADVRHEGMGGMATTIRLKSGDGPEQSRPLPLEEGRLAEAEFAVEIRQAGEQRLTLSIDPVAGEATDENNTVQRWIKVLPERMKVCAFSGSPGWDFQYLRNTLARTPWVNLTDGILNASATRVALTPEQILEQDVIILNDVPVNALDARQWDAVKELAELRGGSVILVAGDAHLPSEYTSLPQASELLPFDPRFKPAWRIWPGETPAFRFAPDPHSPAIDALKLAGDAGGVQRWEELPGCYRYLQLPDVASPGATGASELKPGALALLREMDSRSPVLTERRVGAGRAFFLGINETWRWRYRVGDRDTSRFWLQLIRYASEEPYFARSGLLALDADRLAAEPDQPVRVRARVLHDRPGHSGSYDLEVLRDGRTAATSTLVAVGAAGTGRYESTLRLPSGEYRLRLSEPAAEGRPAAQVEMPLHVIPTLEAEMRDISGDDRLLRRLAEASGGEFLTLDEVSRLPARIASLAESQSRFVERSLWDSPYLYLFVVACLGAEWALRKRFGLA